MSLYYIDFDNTLYNTPLLRKAMLDCLSAAVAKRSANDIKDVRTECEEMFNREGIYNIYRLAGHLAKKYQLDPNPIVDELNDVILDGRKYLYPDVLPFLRRLREAGHKAILLTYDASVLQFQTTKVTGAHVGNYFDAMFITQTLKYQLDIDYKDGIFIDDDPESLKGLANSGAGKIIRMRRPGGKYSQRPINIECEDISSLDELKV